MSKLITVRSLQPFDSHNAGEVFGLTPAEYERVVRRGLVVSTEAEKEQAKAAAKAEAAAKKEADAKARADKKAEEEQAKAAPEANREDKPSKKRG